MIILYKKEVFLCCLENGSKSEALQTITSIVSYPKVESDNCVETGRCFRYQVLYKHEISTMHILKGANWLTLLDCVTVDIINCI